MSCSGAGLIQWRAAAQVKSASNSPTSSDGDGSGDEGAGGNPKANGQLGGRETHRIDSGSSASTSGAPGDAPPPPYMETLHFFGVFDGHGGAEAALHCAQTLHQRIAEALAAATTGPSGGSGSGGGGSEDAAAAGAAPPVSVAHAHSHAELAADAECSTCPAVGAAVGTEEASLVTLQPSGSLTGAVSAAALASVSEGAVSEPLAGAAGVSPRGLPVVAQRAHSRGNSDRSQSSTSDALVEAALNEAAQAGEPGAPGGPGAGRPSGDEDAFCSVAKFESALQSAFNRTDEEFGKADNAALVGTTAVVALVGSRHLYVANCGARAPLRQAGTDAFGSSCLPFKALLASLLCCASAFGKNRVALSVGG